MDYKFTTKCIYGDNTNNTCENTGAISFPIYQTATFAHPGLGSSTGYDYSRLQNPTREQLENVVCSLENGFDALAFSSGMAAITALMELFHPGDHVISGNDLYGGSIRLFNHINRKNQITFDFIDTSKDDIEKHITPSTKAIFIETPTNPMMNVTDIRKVASIARKHGLLFIVDNTFLSPYFQNPLDLGADVVVHSGTKFMGGHNDTLAGFIVVNSKELSEKLRFIFKTVGSGLAPFDSWLILRGIKTLAIRLERQQQNAFAIVQWLLTNEKVKNVYYPGLPDHPGYEISKLQSSGFGSMLTFEVESADLARHILGSVKLIRFAESLGGVETLITYPITQTHADVSDEDREKNGITETILRISVGIEDISDLINDLAQAF
ncbi:trans-sulfuration enzyme family protein [Parasporobacterium paucivorans]|uniref:Cystathionine gamma-synthase n=1 Tax=Parasporobacterium paucivorans DSM 15970 TaxID=1122934 RepID=A0A1M6E210_9FIRM|nr:PLP-dependent aspartate aminotransferase family protein [Parasporobacterium paucivorans]SHI79481.1 cystathionine gamma-synthase [Parasporobacterium paucivorans DSM 15970]